MKVPSEFDPIRPYEPEELPEVYDKLLADEQFQHILAFVYPNVPVEAIGKKMHGCKTNLDFQRAFCYPILQKLVLDQSTGIDADFYDVDIHNRYTFVSNHRDIVLDAAFLDKLLLDTGFSTTAEIAIGDNLLAARLGACHGTYQQDVHRRASIEIERDAPCKQAHVGVYALCYLSEAREYLDSSASGTCQELQ